MLMDRWKKKEGYWLQIENLILLLQGDIGKLVLIYYSLI